MTTICVHVVHVLLFYVVTIIELPLLVTVVTVVKHEVVPLTLSAIGAD